jgi:hypothetical protein
VRTGEGPFHAARDGVLIKALLERRGMLDRWYRFQDDETRGALREGCPVERIELEAKG